MSLFQKPITGIDLGSKTIKIATCSRRGNNFKVIKANKIELPEAVDINTELDYYLETVRRSCEIAKIPLNNVALVANDNWYQSFTVTLPNMPQKELENAILYEIKRQSEINNLSNITFDYYLNNRSENNNEYYVFYSEADRIRTIIDIFQKHKIKVRYIDVKEMITLALYRELYADDKQVKCFFDLGYTDLKMTFTKEDRLIFTRTISYGSKQIFEILKNTVSEENLIELFAFKGLNDELIEKILRDYIDEMLNELLRTVKFFTATFRLGEPSNMIYNGGVFAIPGFHKYMCQNIPYPCILNNVLDILDYKEKGLRETGFMFNYAVGAAIR